MKTLVAEVLMAGLFYCEVVLSPGFIAIHCPATQLSEKNDMLQRPKYLRILKSNK